MATKTLISLYKDHAVDLPEVIKQAESNQFDVVITPIVNPLFYREFQNEPIASRHILFTRSDLILKPQDWLNKVVVKLSDYIDCDSENHHVRKHSEATLIQEMLYAAHLAHNGYSIVRLKGTNTLNLARIITNNLKGKRFFFE